jgi:glycosyltransferase involved in cell wall biosynthesis
VVHGQTGVLALPDNAGAMAAACAALLQRPDRAAQFGAAARARMERLFLWERWVPACLAMYRSGKRSDS